MQLHLLSFKIQQCQVLLCTAIHVSVQAEAWYQKKSWFISELLPVRAVRRLVNNLQNHNFKKWPCLSTATNSEVFFFFRWCLLSSSLSMSLLLLDMSPLSTLSCFTCFPLDFLCHKLFTILCLFSLPAPPLSRNPSRLLKGLLLWDRVCERES